MKTFLFLLLAASIQAAPARAPRVPFYLQPTPAAQAAPAISDEARAELVRLLKEAAERQRLTAQLINGDEKTDWYFLGREQAYLSAAIIVETYKPEGKK